MVRIIAGTDVGLVRHNNEDYFHCDRDSGLAILADGVGGHDFGEVASELATVSCHNYLMLEPDLSDLRSLEAALLESIKYANQKVADQKKAHPEYAKMGTTLSCFHLTEDALRYAWVGDSRLYLISPDRNDIRQLSTDHSLYEELLLRGENPGWHTRSILTRMIGHNAYVRPDSGTVALEKGDIVLACSDGLSDYVSDLKVLDIVSQYKDQGEDCVEALIAAANNEGGKDNTTIILGFPD